MGFADAGAEETDLGAADDDAPLPVGLVAGLAPAVGEPAPVLLPPVVAVEVFPSAGEAVEVPSPLHAVSTTARTAAEALITVVRRTVPGLCRSDFVEVVMVILSGEWQSRVTVSGTNDFQPTGGCRGHRAVAGS
jgi:hypothetical protein